MFSPVAALLVAALSIVSSVQAAPSSLVARQAHQGQGTYYNPGLGACGTTNSDSDLIVAVSQSVFDTFPGAGANPNSNPICGKSITASHASTGANVTVTVVDRCVGCKSDDLDFSPAAFTALAGSLDAGRIGINWQFN